MANPISINSYVVYLRLYWFEKRFQHLVKEARSKRGTISKSKAKAHDHADVERGVNGRNITVMRNGQRSRMTNDGILLDNRGMDSTDVKDYEPDESAAASGSAAVGMHDVGRSGITFASTVKKSDRQEEDAVKIPMSRSEEEHVAILERQREDNETLRIPGPRDAERGLRPELVVQGENDDNLEGLEATLSRPSEYRTPAITIEEPDRRRLRESDGSTDKEEVLEDAKAALNAFSFLKPRKPRIFSKKDKKLHHEEDQVHAPQWRIQRRSTLSALKTALSRDKDDTTPYLSWEPTIGRNSQFPDLTEEQREELGGIEYRSLKTLALVLAFYFFGFHLMGVIGLVPWILNMSRWGAVVDAAGQDRTWWGFFTSSSAFMDLGFTLTPDSMNSFNTAVWPLLLMSFLIVIGNTGFPVMLRFMIWLLSLVVPRGTGLYEEVRFLLDHPRRCFTLLFPSGATWWLFWLLVILNGLDVIFFIVLDVSFLHPFVLFLSPPLLTMTKLGSGPVVDMPTGIKILNGLFEAASTRTAGFSCVNLALLHPGVQVSYMIMMYISVFPIAISVRRTNVYEEDSLGIYGGGEVEEGNSNGNDLSYVGAHLRRQLSFDLWYIFVGLFILAISEGNRVMANDFSMFAVLFEIISAYGTVGMSLGYTSVNASLCSQFSVVGKLTLIAMMVRGRHRGLPYGLDRAILLPSEALHSKEAADAEARMARQMSHVSNATSGMRNNAARRRRSFSGDRAGKLLTSFLHPGPPKPPVHLAPSHVGVVNPNRRSMDAGSEDFEPYATRAVTSSSMRRDSANGVPRPRPRTSATNPL